jgi:hypothetical protein
MVHNNVVEKIKLLAFKMVYRKMKEGQIVNVHGVNFSLIWRRGHWQRQPVVVSVSQDTSWPVDGAQQCNEKNIISCQNGILKRETRANLTCAHGHSFSLLWRRRH